MIIVTVHSGVYKGHVGVLSRYLDGKALVDFGKTISVQVPYRTRRTPISDSRIEFWTRISNMANIPAKNIKVEQ